MDMCQNSVMGHTFWLCTTYKNAKSTTIATSIKQVLQIPQTQVQSQKLTSRWPVCADKKFFSDMDINFTITGRNEHITAIKRIIQTIIERVQARANQLLFETYPHRIIVDMVYNMMFRINCFPHEDDIHNIMSPKTILTGFITVN